jgi:ribosomal protein S18 acetylase RimI-like enzyme
LYLFFQFFFQSTHLAETETMALKLQQVKLSNIDDFINVQWEAFRNSPGTFSRLFYPQGQLPGVKAFQLALHEKGLSDDHTQYHMVYDTQADAVAGVAKWQFYLDQDEGRARKEERAEQEPVKGIDFGAIADFREVQSFTKGEILQGRPYLYLHTLATHPHYQRHGVGSMLLRWGTTLADELGVAVYLESTMAGKPLYESFGFEPVRRLDFDAKDYGLADPAKHWCMLREPVILHSQLHAGFRIPKEHSA